MNSSPPGRSARVPGRSPEDSPLHVTGASGVFHATPGERDRVTVPGLAAAKGRTEKIVAVTAYDFTFARLCDRSGVDLILVGDSLACVVQGHPTTLPVTLDEMIYHCRCVTRGVSRALVVGDMPFLSYQVSPDQGVLAAGRLIKEGGVGAVKLEGGLSMAPTIARIAAVDIPVVGHVGLTPQSYHRMGGHRMQGRSAGGTECAGSRERVLADARAVEEAGAFAVVLEGIPPDLGAEITSELSIPTIGIGAGPSCDGQILVVNDLLGLDDRFAPSFVKRYLEGGALIEGALREYGAEVRGGIFPARAPVSRSEIAEETHGSAA